MPQILRKLKHENIIEMLDSFENAREFCVVTEFAQVLFSLLFVESKELIYEACAFMLK